ncbi:Aconitate hydratase precursor [compost metagenome]
MNLDGTETFEVKGIENGLKHQQDLDLAITRSNGKTETVRVRSRIDTAVEVDYYNNGGILHYVLRKLM